MSTRPLIAGNWKMFGRRADLRELETLRAAFGAAGGADIVVCPPATLVAAAAAAVAGSALRVGGQDCHTAQEGAHTGDVSAAMLADAGASHVILGHSERRRDHGESDALVRAKTQAAAAAGLIPIVCVGETIEERKAGREGDVVRAQLAASLPDAPIAELVVAYEPIWAIGAGLTATNPQIEAMHALIRRDLEARFGARIRVLYGGSVKPSNAAEIFRAEGVDGALVGGASLRAADFSAILRAHPAMSAG